MKNSLWRTKPGLSLTSSENLYNTLYALKTRQVRTTYKNKDRRNAPALTPGMPAQDWRRSLASNFTSSAFCRLNKVRAVRLREGCTTRKEFGHISLQKRQYDEIGNNRCAYMFGLVVHRRVWSFLCSKTATLRSASTSTMRALEGWNPVSKVMFMSDRK